MDKNWDWLLPQVMVIDICSDISLDISLDTSLDNYLDTCPETPT
jgi:hypothetical protein